MANNNFNNIPIDHDRVESCLRDMEIEDLSVNPKSDKHVIYSGSIDGDRFSLNFFINNGGKCTLGRSAGFSDAAFEKVATQIAEKCRYSVESRLEISVQIPDEHPAEIVEFLCGQGARVLEVVEQTLCTQWRIKGPRGDAVVLKSYKNKTFQAQGVHAQLATWLLDYLSNVLSLDEILDQQRRIYAIPITTEEVKSELRSRMPAVHDYLAEPVRKQFSSAHALSKVSIELEDFAVLAFPALRGIEGFCFQVLRSECHFDPNVKAKLGEYFELFGKSYQMRDVHREDIDPALQELLANSYSMWYRHRHGLFHMDGTVETTRVITSRQEAVRITSEVLDFVDAAYVRYRQSKI